MPDPAIPRNAYSVLVAGTMNPSIHHPQWYRSIGAIDDDELDASLKSGTTGTTPIVSRLQFGSPSLTVICQPSLWMIQSTDENSWARMLKVASLVFAKTNNPTVTAYGLMAQRHIDTDRDAKTFLAASVASLKLGLPTGKSVNTNVTLASAEERFTITSSIQSSVFGDKAVFGLFHCDYPAQEIEGISDWRFEMFATGSAKFFGDIVTAINARAEKGETHE